MQIDQDVSRGPQLRATAISFLTLAWFGVLLRVYTKAFVVKKFLWEDGFVFASLAFYTMYNSFVLVGEHYGSGQHDQDLTPENKLIALRYWYYCEWSYVLTMTVIKVAIGILYLRIFYERWQRLTVWIVLVTVVVTGAGYFCAIVLQCFPVAFIWHRYSEKPQVHGRCLSWTIVLLGTYFHSAVNALSDFTLAGLPVILMWRLRMPFWKKFWIALMMSIGAIAVIATVIRIKFLESLAIREDFLYVTLDIAIWSTVEPGLAIFAVSLSALRPLLGVIMQQRKMQGGRSKLTTVSWRVESPARQDPYDRLRDVQDLKRPSKAYFHDCEADLAMVSHISNSQARSSFRIWHDSATVQQESTEGIVQTTTWTSKTLEIDRQMTEPKLDLDPMTINFDDIPDLSFKT